MQLRERFERKLAGLRDEILKMGSMVDEELRMALKAFETLDVDLAQQVIEADKTVNDKRFAIEEQCFALIVTQQPAARDLRAIVAVMNMIVDLERMGDQAKRIAKVIPLMVAYPKRTQLPELKQMADMVSTMLKECMTAYAQSNVDLARLVANQDNEVDNLYAYIVTHTMEKLAATKKQKKVEATYEILGVARGLERFGDLATNVAERVVYIVTGHVHDMKIDPDDVLDQYLGR